MNIFLPYENDVVASVQSLDDLRLNKQILEVKQLMMKSVDEFDGKKIFGYKNHPIYLHYKDNIGFLLLYGYVCCKEYEWRFGKVHRLYEYFEKGVMPTTALDYPPYTPFYMEGSKGQPNYIRTTENVSELYQRKLINKWQNDKRPPKWTNRDVPEFYKKFLQGETR